MLVELKNLSLPKEVWDKVIKRYEQAITDSHFSAYMLNPKYSDKPLDTQEESAAMSLANEEFPDILPILANMKAKSPPFDKIYLVEQSIIISNVTASAWWKAFHPTVASSNKGIEGLLTAPASSASVERVYSKFGLVHSQLRNQLGTEKAVKLVLFHKALNSQR
jgi:hypothetical protein